MGVRAIVVYKKNKHNMRVYFGLVHQRLLDAALLFKADPPLQPTPGSPVLWDCFLKKIPLRFHTGDYRVQAPMTLSMKDILKKTYSSSTFVWKECKFLCI